MQKGCKPDTGEFLELIDAFKYASYKFTSYSWWFRVPLYLPIGMLIESYWLRRMKKINLEMEAFNHRLNLIEDHE